VAVPGFYDEVQPLDADERADLAKALHWIEQEWRDVAAAPQQWGEPAYNLHERIGARPTLEVNGIRGGYAGDGFKTVLPGKALAKISCRLVANQNPQRIYERVRDYVAQITPPTVRSELCFLEAGDPALIDRHDPAVQAYARAIQRSWDKAPIYVREGGSIPVVVDLQRHITAPVVLMSFGYKGCAAHGPNEHVYLDLWYKGIDTMLYFYEEVSKGL
jgi:acetylornithine deacetylase/succinyl-diaminopimelate desuccinylase-like protein